MNVDRSVPSSLRRHLLGGGGLACLAIGAYFWIRPHDSSSVAFVQGTCIKSGLVLLATWLAFPQLDRLPGWAFAGALLSMLTIAVRPQVLLVLVRVGVLLLPIFFVIWLLRPKSHRRSTR